MDGCEHCDMHGPWHEYQAPEEAGLNLHRAGHDMWRTICILLTPLVDWIAKMCTPRHARSQDIPEDA